MELYSLFLLIGFSIFVGLLIGGVGIGGVLLVPLLTYALELEIHLAIAAVMLSYVFSGTVGTWVYARKGSIKWNMALYLFCSAAPGAFLGALTAYIIPSIGLEIFIAFLTIFAGVNALLQIQKDVDANLALSVNRLLLIGFITGLGSALSGTGGPLILVPALVWLRVPARIAVGLSQAIQIPIAILATIGNSLHGTLDLVTSAIIAISLMFGVFIGARVSLAISQSILEKVVAWVLVLVGTFIISRNLVYSYGLHNKLSQYFFSIYQ